MFATLRHPGRMRLDRRHVRRPGPQSGLHRSRVHLVDRPCHPAEVERRRVMALGTQLPERCIFLGIHRPLLLTILVWFCGIRVPARCILGLSSTRHVVGGRGGSRIRSSASARLAAGASSGHRGMLRRHRRVRHTHDRAAWNPDRTDDIRRRAVSRELARLARSRILRAAAHGRPGRDRFLGHSRAEHALAPRKHVARSPGQGARRMLDLPRADQARRVMVVRVSGLAAASAASRLRRTHRLDHGADTVARG